jgi:hypothetical protein
VRQVTLLVAVWALVCVAWLVSYAHGGPARPATSPARPSAHVLYQGHGVRWWAQHAVAARRDANHLRGVLRARRLHYVRPLEGKYEHAARLAAIAYRVDAETLIRKGRCESSHWTRFVSSVSSARGPWQFLTRGRVHRYGDGELVDGGTWATTPYWSYSPFDPLAAAMAAAYMHSVGRGGEWSCR